MTKQDEIQQNHLLNLLNHYKEENKQALAHLSIRYGKTKLSCALLRGLFSYDQTTLIAYPDNKIREVWESECLKWGYSNPNITYVNFSSLWKYEDKVFDMVVCDEVHELSENQLDILHIIITNDRNIKFLGLSGTISKETQQRIGIPIVVEYSTSSGIEDKILADYRITVHSVDLDTRIKTLNKKGKLLSEKQRYDNYSFVINRMRKNGDNSMHLALARNRLSLSSIGKMEYVRKLLLQLNGKRTLVFTGLAKVADDIGIPSYHSKSPSDLDYRMFLEEKYHQLALAAIGKTGVTYPNLDCVILLNFTYNAEESSQVLFRSLKLDYKEKCADLHLITLNEPPEIKKVKESLSMLDKTKITYL